MISLNKKKNKRFKCSMCGDLIENVNFARIFFKFSVVEKRICMLCLREMGREIETTLRMDKMNDKICC